MISEFTVSRIASSAAFWGAKIDAVNGLILVEPHGNKKSALVSLAGRYAEAGLREIQLLIANDKVIG